MLKEATYINKSLSFLEQAIIALGDQKRDHIPFRQCKLTHALKDSLGAGAVGMGRRDRPGLAAAGDHGLAPFRWPALPCSLFSVTPDTDNSMRGTLFCHPRRAVLFPQNLGWSFCLCWEYLLLCPP